MLVDAVMADHVRCVSILCILSNTRSLRRSLTATNVASAKRIRCQFYLLTSSHRVLNNAEAGHLVVFQMVALIGKDSNIQPLHMLVFFPCFGW